MEVERAEHVRNMARAYSAVLGWCAGGPRVWFGFPQNPAGLVIFAGKKCKYSSVGKSVESVAFEIQKTKKFTLTTNQDDYRPFGGLFDTLRLSLGAVFYDFSLESPLRPLRRGTAVRQL